MKRGFARLFQTQLDKDVINSSDHYYYYFSFALQVKVNDPSSGNQSGLQKFRRRLLSLYKKPKKKTRTHMKKGSTTM